MADIAFSADLSPKCPKRPQKRRFDLPGINIKAILIIVSIVLIILLPLLTDVFPIFPESGEGFTYSYGREETDDNAQALIQTSDGGLALAGITWSFGEGNNDMWLVKTDFQGNPQWNRSFGGKEKEWARDLIQTPENGYLLTGATTSFGSGGSDAWVVRTDAEGNLQWEKSFGGSKEEAAYALELTHDGGIVIAGSTSSYGAGADDIWLMKLDEDGSLQWSATFGGADNECAFDVIETLDGGFALTGFTSSYAIGHRDVWLIKTDRYGNLQWNKTFGDSGRDQAFAVVQTDDEGFVFAGERELDEDNYRDIWLLKTDILGNIEWSETFGGSGREWAETLIQTADQGFALTGYVTTSKHSGFADIILLKTSTKGKLLWTRTYGGEYHDVGSALIETKDGGLAIAGITGAPWFYPYYGGGDMYLLKTNAEGLQSNTQNDLIRTLELINRLLIVIPLFIFYKTLKEKNKSVKNNKEEVKV